MQDAGDASQLLGDLQARGEELERAHARIAALEASLADAGSCSAELEGRLAETAAAGDAARSQAAALEESHAALKLRLAQMEARLVQSEAACSAAAGQQTSLQERCAAGEARAGAVGAAVSALQPRLEKLQQQLADAEQCAAVAQGAGAAAQAEAAAAREAEAQARAELAQALAGLEATRRAPPNTADAAAGPDQGHEVAVLPYSGLALSSDAADSAPAVAAQAGASAAPHSPPMQPNPLFSPGLVGEAPGTPRGGEVPSAMRRAQHQLQRELHDARAEAAALRSQLAALQERSAEAAEGAAAAAAELAAACAQVSEHESRASAAEAEVLAMREHLAAATQAAAEAGQRAAEAKAACAAAQAAAAEHREAAARAESRAEAAERGQAAAAEAVGAAEREASAAAQAAEARAGQSMAAAEAEAAQARRELQDVHGRLRVALLGLCCAQHPARISLSLLLLLLLLLEAPHRLLRLHLVCARAAQGGRHEHGLPGTARLCPGAAVLPDHQLEGHLGAQRCQERAGRLGQQLAALLQVQVHQQAILQVAEATRLRACRSLSGPAAQQAGAGAARPTLPVASTQVSSVSASRGAAVTLANTRSPGCRLGRLRLVTPVRGGAVRARPAHQLRAPAVRGTTFEGQGWQRGSVGAIDVHVPCVPVALCDGADHRLVHVGHVPASPARSGALASSSRARQLCCGLTAAAWCRSRPCRPACSAPGPLCWPAGRTPRPARRGPP